MAGQGEFKNPVTGKKTSTGGSGKSVSFKGSRAGENFPSSDEVSDDQDWQDYKKEKKLSFAASRTAEAGKFAAWRALRKKKPAMAQTQLDGLSATAAKTKTEKP